MYAFCLTTFFQLKFTWQLLSCVLFNSTAFFFHWTTCEIGFCCCCCIRGNCLKLIPWSARLFLVLQVKMKIRREKEWVRRDKDRNTSAHSSRDYRNLNLKECVRLEKMKVHSCWWLTMLDARIACIDHSCVSVFLPLLIWPNSHNRIYAISPNSHREYQLEIVNKAFKQIFLLRHLLRYDINYLFMFFVLVFSLLFLKLPLVFFIQVRT